MPLTPFHLGPALAAKAAARRCFSLRIFALTQLVIDLETARNIYLHEYPIHRYFHTFAGAVAVSAVTLVVGRYAFNALNPSLRRILRQVEGMPTWATAAVVNITWPAALIGGIVGAISHVFLDAIIHLDVVPFWPWSAANPFLVDGSFNLMHYFCFGIGALALPFWLAGVRKVPGSPPHAGAEGEV